MITSSISTDKHQEDCRKIKIGDAETPWHPLKILSFGAGMQSTALALMSCENAYAVQKGREIPYPKVPVYDLVIFCDLGFEPPWVKHQADFVEKSCESVGIWYKTLDTPLYQDLMRDFGKKRVVSIPWWTLGDDGHKSKMPRNCTIDYGMYSDTEKARGLKMRTKRPTRCTWASVLRRRSGVRKARTLCL